MSTAVSPATVSWLLPIATALITAVSTGFAVWATNSASHNRIVTQLAADAESEKRSRRRERLEELYVEFNRWRNYMYAHHSRYMLVMEGHRSYNDALDETIKEGNVLDAQRLIMITELYFQEVHDQLSKVKEMRDNLSHIQADFSSKYKNDGMPSDSHAEQIREALFEFDQSCYDYLSALVKFTRELI